MASSFVTQISKILCMRTSSNSARTGLVIPHNFKSPPFAFKCRNEDRKAPRPGAVHEAQPGQVEDHLPARLEQRRDVSLELLGIAGVELFAWQDHDCHVTDLLRRQLHPDLLVQAALRFLTREMQFLPRSSRS